MLILGIESSCDETAASVCRDGRVILSNVVRSQMDMHALYGGVVPEIASRSHVECISAVVAQALSDAGVGMEEIDAVAVTYAPGLIGALLVGVNFAKGLAFATGKPLIPVHHIRGHIAANYIAFPELAPPFTCLVVSGGHTLIAEVGDYSQMTILGSTRDDAAGEAFDKAARVLGLPYPGGAQMDALAKGGNPAAYPLPKIRIPDAPWDFSFSGLKTAVLNTANRAAQKGEALNAPDLAAAFCQAVARELAPRAIDAAGKSGHGVLAAAGGVAANSYLRRALEEGCRSAGLRLFVPPLSLCGDNAAMIACQGYYEAQAGNYAGMNLNAYATLSVDAPPRC